MFKIGDRVIIHDSSRENYSNNRNWPLDVTGQIGTIIGFRERSGGISQPLVCFGKDKGWHNGLKYVKLKAPPRSSVFVINPEIELELVEKKLKIKSGVKTEAGELTRFLENM